MQLIKQLTGLFQGFSDKRRLLFSFQDMCEKYLTSNQLTVATVEKIPMDEEPKVPTIAVINDAKVYSEKGAIMGSMSWNT